ncbi:hypothetical protein NKH77_23685 [Streptomyces sp. M19]
MSNFNQSAYPQTAPTPSSGGALDDQSKKFAIIGIVGSLIAFVGAFTVWTVLKADGLGEDRYKSTDGDGVFVIITALIAAALFVGTIVAKKSVLNIGGAGFSLVTLVIAVWNMADPERLATQVAEDKGASSEQIEAALKQVDTSSGPGVYITLVGALIAVAVGVLGFLKGRANQ